MKLDPKLIYILKKKIKKIKNTGIEGLCSRINRTENNLFIFSTPSFFTIHYVLIFSLRPDTKAISPLGYFATVTGI